MNPPILSNDTVVLRMPTPHPSAILVVALLWLTLACAMPLYQLREARRQAQQDLEHLLTAEKLDRASVLTAFERSNQNLDAAASGPCLILAFTSILLVNRLFKLRRRYNALAQELLASGNREEGPGEG